MKLTSTFLILAGISTIQAASAQTTPTPRPVVHHTPTTAATPACAKLFDISSNVPALPPGLPCAKPLFTITTIPAAKLENVSPLEGPGFAHKLGIESTSFTLAYVDIKPGTPQLAEPHKYYAVHYTGWLTNGQKFDSSYDHGEPLPIEYGAHKVILGWDTGLAGMHVGGKRRLYIPYQLAYGPNGQPPTIPGKSDLIFDVEIMSVSDTPPAPKVPPTPPTPPKSPAPGAPLGVTPAPKPATPTPPPTPPAEPAKPTTPPPPQQ